MAAANHKTTGSWLEASADSAKSSGFEFFRPTWRLNGVVCTVSDLTRDRANGIKAPVFGLSSQSGGGGKVMGRSCKVGFTFRFLLGTLALFLFIAANSARPLLLGNLYGLHRAIPKRALLDPGADRVPVLDDAGSSAASRHVLPAPNSKVALLFSGLMVDRAITESSEPSPRQILTSFRRLPPSGEDPH